MFLGKFVHLFALFKSPNVKQFILGNLVQIMWLGPGYIHQSKLSLLINLDQIILDKLLGLGKFK